MLLSKAVQHVEHSAARRLVGLQEHDVGVGSAGAQRRPLSIRGGEDGASHRVDTVWTTEKQKLALCSKGARFYCTPAFTWCFVIIAGSLCLSSFT